MIWITYKRVALDPFESGRSFFSKYTNANECSLLPQATPGARGRSRQSTSGLPSRPPHESICPLKIVAPVGTIDFLATNTLQRANIRSANRHIAKPCAHPRAELSIHPSCSSVGKTASISSPFIRFRMVVLPVLSRPSISVSPSPDGFF